MIARILLTLAIVCTISIGASSAYATGWQSELAAVGQDIWNV